MKKIENINEFKKKIFESVDIEDDKLSNIMAFKSTKAFSLFKYKNKSKTIKAFFILLNMILLFILVHSFVITILLLLDLNIFAFISFSLFLLSNFGLSFSAKTNKKAYYLDLINKIDDPFYEKMFNLYNYKEDSLSLIINSMKKKHYDNPIEKKIVNYVCKIKEKEISDVFDAKLVSEKPNNVENSDLLKDLNKNISKVSI